MKCSTAFCNNIAVKYDRDHNKYNCVKCAEWGRIVERKGLWYTTKEVVKNAWNEDKEKDNNWF